MIYLVKNAYLKEMKSNKGNFEDDLWQVMNEVKDEAEENGIWQYGTRFDISCDNGTINRREEFDDFSFNCLEHRADEIRQIIKDIHQCLEKQNSTHIDLFFKPEGVVILLSTGEQIDNALFYKYVEEIGKDKKGYRKVTHHFRGNDLDNPLKIALEFDYIIHKKTMFKWDVSMDNDGLRDILKDCVKESKNVNYSYSDVRTYEEIQEDNRKQKQAEQEQQIQQQQQEQEQYDKQLQQMLEQFEETKRQMMLLMGIYMAQQQQEEEFEEDDDFEEFEEDDE